MRRRLSLWAASTLVLSACSIGSGWNPAPSAPAPVRTGNATSTTGIEPIRPATTPSAPGFQIAQCYSPGAPTVAINYPPGWARRVSRAETQDELLGGSTANLGETDAFAKPVSAVSYRYPSAALNPPVEGICELKFDLSRQGEASNIIAACSSSHFLETATEAVKATQFEPIQINGNSALGINLTYGMKFCLAG